MSCNPLARHYAQGYANGAATAEEALASAAKEKEKAKKAALATEGEIDKAITDLEVGEASVRQRFGAAGLGVERVG